ncbi:tyrosine-type recombinase/integrase [Sphingomonas rhizophila]|uniref:Tyrosine-type recombinase/integrase n=2 Tax=Sphingomonas rhizophila TaxID=2071607 RepID=A0A7G9SEI7_9SPHN|nr:integrase arm-type DNA-binding domain-containing protein [Sphingomonas rhizophila]QNN66262.1 tyrosine-type recombinase/integrase [Sphingomonas rhizophila]
MALTDVAVRNAKPRDRAYKLADSGGLYLLVTTAGGRLWRLKYRIDGIERKLALGRYPDVSLGDARKARDSARQSIAVKIDPSTVKRREKALRKTAAGTTFSGIADEAIDKAKRAGKSSATISKLEWARDWLLPSIGHRPIEQIEPQEILDVLRSLERKGQLETARRVRAFASRVFRFAVVTARAKSDPAALLAEAIASPRPKHLAAILDPRRAAELLRAIQGYSGQPSTILALKLSPHVFLRPGELRRAEWSEINFEKAVWRIPAEKMKMRRDHAVPLSKQAVAILREAQALTGNQRYVFGAFARRDRPLSENTINGALRRLKFESSEMSAHGFRSMASTLLNESGRWSPDAIERALAHKDRDAIRGAYHRGAHWEERVQMAQWWSDYLDGLQVGVD